MRKAKKKIYDRFFTPLFLIPIATVAIVGIAFATNSFAGNSGKQPNILIIQADDQDLASINAVNPQTGKKAFSNLWAIAEKGTRFENAFVSHGLCCPSRATLYTGQYDHNHGVITNQPPHGGYNKLDHTNTLPVWLKQAGYWTAHLGKYMNGYSLNANPLVPPGWDRWFTLPNAGKLFDYPVVTESGEVIQYGSAESDYQIDVMARKAAGFIQTEDFGENPFFMVVDFFNPHVGPDGFTAVPAPRHLGDFQGYEPIFPPSFNEADISDKPSAIAGNQPLNTFWIDQIKEWQRRRLESLLSVDEGVGLIMKTLDKKGLLGNTIVIFTSDNGWHQGEHRIKWGKDTQYDESLRVPLFMRGPGIPKNKVIGSPLVVNIDYAPTIVELTGATAGRVMDGRSILPLVQNPTMPWRTNFLIENLRAGGTPNQFMGVRGKTASYVEYEYWINPDTPGPDDIELYVDDPYQMASKHADPAYASWMSEMQTRLNVLRTCSGTVLNSPTSCW